MSSTSRRLRKRLLLKLSPSPSRCSSRLLVLIGSLLLLLLLHRRRRGGVPAAESDSEAEEDVSLRKDLFFFHLSFTFSFRFESGERVCFSSLSAAAELSGIRETPLGSFAGLEKEEAKKKNRRGGKKEKGEKERQ